jgi:hypothetical protein
MSLLQLDSTSSDDAARGESFTRGTSHLVLAAIAAAVLVILTVAIVVIVDHKPPAVVGEIVSVWVHPVHTETTGLDANGDPMPKESFDQVLVFVQVKLKNQTDHPITLQSIQVNATLDGVIHNSYASSVGKYEQLFIAYPELVPYKSSGLSPEAVFNAGQSHEGTIVSAFRISKQQWDARKDLNFAFNFLYQPVLVLTPHSAIIER